MLELPVWEGLSFDRGDGLSQKVRPLWKRWGDDGDERSKRGAGPEPDYTRSHKPLPGSITPPSNV